MIEISPDDLKQIKEYPKEFQHFMLGFGFCLGFVVLALPFVSLFAFIKNNERQNIANEHNQKYYEYLGLADQCFFLKSETPSYDDIENVPKDSYKWNRNQKAKKYTDNLISAIYRGESNIVVKIPKSDNEIDPENGEYFCVFLNRFLLKNIKLPIYIDKEVDMNTFTILFHIKAEPKRSIFQ